MTSGTVYYHSVRVILHARYVICACVLCVYLVYLVILGYTGYTPRYPVLDPYFDPFICTHMVLA